MCCPNHLIPHVQCPNGDIKDACKDKECNSEDWLEDEFEEAVSE